MENYEQYLYFTKESLKFIVQYILPAVAIIISWFSYKDTRRSREIQARLHKVEEKIKTYELEKIEKKKQEAKLACVEARIMNISKGKYRFKIWNSGQATAYHVDYQVPGDCGVIIPDPKVPYEFLDPGKSFEEIIVVHFSTKRKFMLTTNWNDKEGQAHSKKQIVSI